MILRQMKKLIMTAVFFQPPNTFDQELVDDLFKNLKHKKIEHPYIEPQVQDIEIQVQNDNFSDLEQLFNELDNAAAERKKQNDIFGLIDYILDENNVFNDELKTEGIYIEGNLFDDTDQRDIKKISEDKVSEINPPDILLIVDLPDEDPINQRKTVRYDPVTNSIYLSGI